MERHRGASAEPVSWPVAGPSGALQQPQAELPAPRPPPPPRVFPLAHPAPPLSGKGGACVGPPVMRGSSGPPRPLPAATNLAGGHRCDQQPGGCRPVSSLSLGRPRLVFPSAWPRTPPSARRLRHAAGRLPVTSPRPGGCHPGHGCTRKAPPFPGAGPPRCPPGPALTPGPGGTRGGWRHSGLLPALSQPGDTGVQVDLGRVVWCGGVLLS